MVDDTSSTPGNNPGPAVVGGLAVLLSALGVAGSAHEARAGTVPGAVQEAGAMATVAQPEPAGQNTDAIGGPKMALIALALLG